MILVIIFFLLAAMCNAVMDTTNHHYHKSIFNNKKLDNWFWNGEISWRNKYNNRNPYYGFKKLFNFETSHLKFKPLIWLVRKLNNINYPVQFTDAFHFFKSLMIIFLCLSASCNFKGWYFIIVFCVNGLLWNGTFNIFYNHILIKKNENNK